MTSEVGRHDRSARLVETHSAVLVFIGDRVVKLKKSVDLGFLDFRDRTVRLAACRNEVTLNRRLSPDVYLGVADVVGPDGELTDHLVVMRRLPEETRLSTLVACHAPLAEAIAKLASQLAAFHSRCPIPTDASAIAGPDALRALWLSSLDPMRGYPPGLLDPARLQQIRDDALRYLVGRHDLLNARVRDGRIRDGHGDLLAEDIFCLPDGPRILDCLEFDRRLRAGDVLADIAFLAMDLEHIGAPGLATQLLDAYHEFSNEAHPMSLEHHYIAYRALVRAKVSCVRFQQGDQDAAADARRLLGGAADHLTRGRVRLIAVGGLPASGKSTLGLQLADELHAAVLSSDDTRKEMAGLSPDNDAASPLDTGLYRPETTRAVYAELLDRAGALLRQGLSVVVDASWSDIQNRADLNRIAHSCHADLTNLHCVAPPAITRARLADRRRPEHGSDATIDIYDQMAARWPSWPDAHQIDTTTSTDRSLRTAKEFVVNPPRGAPET